MRITGRMLAAAVTALGTAVVPLALSAPAHAAAPPGVPKGAVPVKVVQVVDGDTLVVNNKGRKLNVHLLEADTPESGRCWAKAATTRTKGFAPPSSVVYLRPGAVGKDAKGQRVYYVWNKSGVFLNRSLVRYGYAKFVATDVVDKYTRLLRAEQDKAKSQRLRIWSGKCDNGKPGTGGPGTGGGGGDGDRGGTGGGGTGGGGGGGTGGGGNDPRYGTCGEANAKGLGPYRRGIDPEYEWYQDRDGDGVVCER
ncbi:thermonuclease family protein [Sinosporangium siamense]|uniref:TNase-like domain-containing protein n=1 Tax=Sinosporangium siamense TaxID=1367973 RepID=A0A919VE02_9ACTN|nr:excalibur calcium-binding domain-containing protein [Sinosporangium siamense]GII94639.1 hypothetical protein Ssi02_48700 [Sinosporangium siamense]